MRSSPHHFLIFTQQGRCLPDVISASHLIFHLEPRLNKIKMMQHFQERQFLETSSKTHVSHTRCNVTWNSSFFFSFKYHSGGALFRLCYHLHHHHIPAQQCYPSSNDDVISRLQMTNSHTHPHNPACSVDFRGSHVSLVKTFNTRL